MHPSRVKQLERLERNRSRSLERRRHRSSSRSRSHRDSRSRRRSRSPRSSDRGRVSRRQHRRSSSPSRRYNRSRSRSRPRRRTPPRRNNDSRAPRQRRNNRESHQNHTRRDWGGPVSPEPEKTGDLSPVEVANYQPSGALYEDSHDLSTLDAVKYREPSDSAPPDMLWRLYVFTDDDPDAMDTLYIHRQSHFIVGKDSPHVHIPLGDPSCSIHHAVIQYRNKQSTDAVGNPVFKNIPYLMDLKSDNGTFLNGERIESEKYYQLLEKDCIQFGNSTRQFVILHDKSK